MINEIESAVMQHPLLVDILNRGKFHNFIRLAIEERLAEWSHMLLLVRSGKIPPEIGREVSLYMGGGRKSRVRGGSRLGRSRMMKMG